MTYDMYDPAWVETIAGQKFRFIVVDLAQDAYDWVECPVCFAVLRSVGTIEHLKSHGIAEEEQ